MCRQILFLVALLALLMAVLHHAGLLKHGQITIEED